MCLISASTYYRYEYYYALVRDFPDLQFTINGGINTIDEVMSEFIKLHPNDSVANLCLYFACVQHIAMWNMVLSFCMVLIYIWELWGQPNRVSVLCCMLLHGFSFIKSIFLVWLDFMSPLFLSHWKHVIPGGLEYFTSFNF